MAARKKIKPMRNGQQRRFAVTTWITMREARRITGLDNDQLIAIAGECMEGTDSARIVHWLSLRAMITNGILATRGHLLNSKA